MLTGFFFAGTEGLHSLFLFLFGMDRQTPTCTHSRRAYKRAQYIGGTGKGVASEEVEAPENTALWGENLEVIRAWIKSSTGLRLRFRDTTLTQAFKIRSLTESKNEKEEFTTGEKKHNSKGEKVRLRKRGLSLERGDREKSPEEGEKKTRCAEWGLREEAGLIGATGGIKEGRVRNAARWGACHRGGQWLRLKREKNVNARKVPLWPLNRSHSHLILFRCKWAAVKKKKTLKRIKKHSQSNHLDHPSKWKACGHGLPCLLFNANNIIQFALKYFVLYWSRVQSVDWTHRSIEGALKQHLSTIKLFPTELN